MKKIFLLIAFALSFAAVNAQSTMLSQYGKSVDTITNGSTKYLTSAKLIGYYKVVTIQFVVTEISGTTDGTVDIMGSMDGVNWYSLGDTTYSLGDATVNTQHWKLIDVGENYLRVKFTGSGTHSDKVTAVIYAKNEQ